MNLSKFKEKYKLCDSGEMYLEKVEKDNPNWLIDSWNNCKVSSWLLWAICKIKTQDSNHPDFNKNLSLFALDLICSTQVYNSKTIFDFLKGNPSILLGLCKSYLAGNITKKEFEQDYAKLANELVDINRINPNSYVGILAAYVITIICNLKFDKGGKLQNDHTYQAFNIFTNFVALSNTDFRNNDLEKFLCDKIRGQYKMPIID